MKKVLIGLVISALSLIGIQSSDAIKSIAGVQAACDTTLSGCASIPLTPTTLCTVSCAFRSSPSYASATEFWASSGTGTGSCVRSTDGGATWPACASQPFATGANEEYAGASDGSVIAAGATTGPNTCTIARSTSNGTNWSTVFTEANQCNPGNSEGQYLYCLSDGRCEWAVLVANTNTFRIYRSSNNGQTWTAGETGSASCGTGAGSAWNGSGGIIPSENAPCGGGNLATAFKSTGDTWTVSTAWTGAQGDCWGSLVLNNVGFAICNAGTTYTMYTSTGAVQQALALPGILQAIDAGGPAVAINSTTMYVLATATSPAGVGIYVSRDSGVTFSRIGTETSGGGASIRGGNMFFANGCVYWSGGVVTRRFAKIC